MILELFSICLQFIFSVIVMVLIVSSRDAQCYNVNFSLNVMRGNVLLICNRKVCLASIAKGK